MSDAVVVTREGAVVWIELNRPEVRNALRTVDIVSLTSEVRTAAADERTHVIVIGSATRGSFCTGADLSPEERVNVANQTSAAASDELFATLADTPVPLVASIGGPAYGAGFAIALSCDIRVASHDATFAIPAARLGIPYPIERMTQLVSVFGSSTARTILLLGKKVTGDRLYELGIADAVVDAADLRAETSAIAQQLAGCDARVMAYLKTGLRVADAGTSSALSPDDVRSMRAEIVASPGYAPGGGTPPR